MADQFLAEIRIFAGNFAPTGWAMCNGQLLNISQNTALFALLGTTYGGDGRSTFGLPNLVDRVPLCPGDGSGLQPRTLGEEAGSTAVTLLTSEIPVHTHSVQAQGGDGTATTPTGNVFARPKRSVLSVSDKMYRTPGAFSTGITQALSVAGGSVPHNNLQPYLALNFIIALQGIFPPRS
jgi:microcystin-dependent protein